ncbi:MAG: hypothetical protein HOV79_18100 [Hamadaea sp.]|nr:hypothetical protein [Hamadaea sp.]
MAKMFGGLNRERPAPSVLDLLPETPDAAQLAQRIRHAGNRPSSDLADVLISASRNATAEDRIVVLRALQDASARFWSALDGLLRRQWWHAPVWSSGLASRIGTGTPDLLELAMAGCHHNGYLREAAVAALARHRQPVAATLLALRCGDWVEEVREGARADLAARLPTMAGDELVAVVEAALHLENRSEGTWLADQVRALVRSMPASEMPAVLAMRFHRSRRSAYRIAIEAGRLTTEQLIATATNDGDQMVRALCARAATADADIAQLHRLAASRIALVRAEAVHALAKRGELATAEDAITDASLVVRAAARNALKLTGPEIADRYRELARRPPASPGVIAGLGEVGDQSDVDQFISWLAHPNARARATAVLGLRRLGVTRPDVLKPMLHDSSAAVVAQVVLSLKRHAGQLDAAALEDLLDPREPAQRRRAAHRLLMAGNVWRRLIADLRLLAGDDDTLRRQARSDLMVWLDKQAATTWGMPTPQQAAELASLLRENEALLGERTTRLLRFHAGTE